MNPRMIAMILDDEFAGISTTPLPETNLIAVFASILIHRRSE